MKPTSKLRFVVREGKPDPFYKTPDMKPFVPTHTILQQFWEPSDEPYEEWLKVKDGEWRDIPLEKEE